MSAKTQQRRRLTKAEMDRIKDAAARSWVEAVVETFKCFGIDVTAPYEEGEPRFRCSDYAIPKSQWCAIGQWCADSPHAQTDLGRVNHLLDWGNYGPSGYDE